MSHGSLDPPPDPRILLYNAAESGDLGKVKEILPQLVDIGLDFQINSKTPLFAATEYNHVEVVDFLINNGATVDIRSDNTGYTALYKSAGIGSVPITSLLLSKGANINSETSRLYSNKQTPLHIASENNHIRVVELLIKMRADINNKNVSGNTPLHIASSNRKYYELLNLLLENGADVNIKNEEGNTPLHIASEMLNVALVNLLLENGAEIDNKNFSGNTPIDLAVQNNNYDVIEFLESKGAHRTNINTQEKTVQELIKKYGDTWYRENKQLFDDFKKAVQSGQLAEVERIKEQGDTKNINLVNIKYPNSGDTIRPLNWALIGKHFDVAEYLINKGANVYWTDWNHCTPLYYAIRYGPVKLVELLIGKGLDVNNFIKKSTPTLPLQEAVKRGDVEIIELLLKNHTNINEPDDDGTAIQLAEKLGNQTIIDILRKYQKPSTTINADTYASSTTKGGKRRRKSIRRKSIRRKSIRRKSNRRKSIRRSSIKFK